MKENTGSVRNWVIGIVLVILAVVVSSVGTAQVVSFRSALLAASGVYICALIVRVLFLKLSAKILSIKNATWGKSVLVVGANAAFLVILTMIGTLAGASGRYATAGLFLVTAFFAFFLASRVLRTSFLETLALYVLSFAFLLITFAAVVLIFHPSFNTILRGI